MDVSTSKVANSLPKMIPGKIPWPGGPSIKQYFSLPTSIIYYMANNPSSPEVYNKLIQSCKYFFEENPILVVYGMDETMICANEKCQSSEEECCVDVDIKKTKSKIWLIDELTLSDEIPNFISFLCPKLYRCDIIYFTICEMDVLYDDFKCLTLSVKCMELDNVKMTYSNGKPVMLENIIEAIPNVEEFYYEFVDGFSVTSALTLKNIAKLQNRGNLQVFRLSDTPEVFNVEELSVFMKELKDTKISIEFIYFISPEYEDQLETLIDTIIQSDIYNRVIMFSGQDIEKFKIMESRYIDPDDDEDMDALNDYGSDVDSDYEMEDIDYDGSFDEMDDIDEDDV